MIALTNSKRRPMDLQQEHLEDGRPARLSVRRAVILSL